MNDKMYARYTQTLHDVLIEYPTLLDNLQLETAEQTLQFKELFIARFEIYEIGGETINQFKLFIENTFKIEKGYFQELINAYYQNINYLEGVVNTNEQQYIELPNKITANEYITNKTKSTSKGGYTLTELKTEYIKQLRNVYLEFVNRFKKNFILIYE